MYNSSPKSSRAELEAQQLILSVRAGLLLERNATGSSSLFLVQSMREFAFFRILVPHTYQSPTETSIIGK